MWLLIPKGLKNGNRHLRSDFLHPMKYLEQNLKIGQLSVSPKSDLEQAGQYE